MKSEFIMFHFKDDEGSKRTIRASNTLDCDSQLVDYLSERQDKVISLIKMDTGINAVKPILATLSN